MVPAGADLHTLTLIHTKRAEYVCSYLLVLHPEKLRAIKFIHSDKHLFTENTMSSVFSNVKISNILILPEKKL